MRPPSSSSGRLGLALAISGALAAGLATLMPLPDQSDRVDVIPASCIVCGDLGGTDIVLNLLLLTPMAAGLALMGFRTGQVFLIAGITTLGIETAQIAWIPGRDASLSDLLTNTTGATVAAFLVWRRRSLLSPRPREAIGLTLAGLIVWIGLETLGGWSLAPSLPHTQYRTQWAASLPHLERFTGRVQGVSVGERFLASGRIADAEAFRQRLLNGEAPFSVSAITGRPPSDLAPILSVFDERYREILMLGQNGDQAVFRVRTGVSDLKLRPTTIAITGALPTVPGEPVHLTASYARGRYVVRVESSRGTLERTLDASPNWVWSYVMPFERYPLGPEVYALTALWLGGLLAPIGYWTRKTGRRLALPAVAGGVLLTLLLVPAVFALRPIHWSEWLAAAAGLGTGYLLAGRFGRVHGDKAAVRSTPVAG